MEKENDTPVLAVLQKTSWIIHQFYDRNIDAVAEVLDPDFLWIGAYEFQYIKGREPFLRSIRSESQEAPVQISEEELGLLAQEQALWVVYGKFTAMAKCDDGSLLLAKIRNTFVWKQAADGLVLLHIHGSHARDVPLEFSEKLPPFFGEHLKWFDYLKGVDRAVGPPKSLIFRTQNEQYHFLPPSELIYVKAEGKHCMVCARGHSFQSRAVLAQLEEKNALLLRIHRSFLVNVQYIRSIKRYEVTLTDRTVLPVGKERYMMVKERLLTFGKGMHSRK